MTKEEVIKELKQVEKKHQNLQRTLEQIQQEEARQCKLEERIKRQENMVDIMVSDDYAVYCLGDYHFYYGYEYGWVINPQRNTDEQWGFFVKKILSRDAYGPIILDTTTIYHRPAEELPKPDDVYDMSAWLVMGMGQMIADGFMELIIHTNQCSQEPKK